MRELITFSLLWASALLASLGCGGEADVSTGGALVDTTQDAARDTAGPPPTWALSAVAAGGAGRQPSALALADGGVAVAFFDEAGAPGELCDPSAPSGGAQSRWSLRYAAADGEGGWRVEPVAELPLLGPPRGLSLALDKAGAPMISALTGEPALAPPYCGANDLGLYRRDPGGAWQVSVAVSESGEAPVGEPASDYGTVVGLWPALALDPVGAPVIAYQDAHAGSLQGDDFKRADLELAWGDGAGGWRHLAVDMGRGAGDFNALAFDGAGRPLVLTYNPRSALGDDARGLWLARSEDAGVSWSRVRLFGGGTTERPSLAVDPRGGEPWVAWYDPSLGLPFVAHLVDAERFEERGGGWEIAEVGDHQYDEGRHPSLALSASGVLALAYYRCARASAGLGQCSPDQDALVFAWRDAGRWEREVVDAGGDGLCGMSPSLVFVGDEPVIFYQCQVRGPEGFEMELRAARRGAL